MGLKGNLASVSLADVFQVLSHGSSTGLLRIQAPEGTRFVEIQDGAISIVSRGANRIPIGDLLCARGLIEKDGLQRALAKQKESGKLLGQMMVDMGLVQMQDLEAALRFQVEEEICDLFLLKEADFDFLTSATLDANMALGGGFMRLRIDPNSILLEAARRVDEWESLEERIPNQAMLFQLEPPGQEMLQSNQGLSPEGMVLLELCREHRTVDSMVQKACLGRINTNLLLVELWDAGLIKPTSFDQYLTIAKDHVAGGRLDEAERIAAYGATVDTDAGRKAELTKIKDDVAKKRKLAEGKEIAEEGRIRSSVIRRRPAALIIKKKRSPLGPILFGLIALILAGGAAWYFLPGMMKGSSVPMEDQKQYDAWVNQIDTYLANGEYGKCADLFATNFRHDELRKKALEKLQATENKIKDEMAVFNQNALDAFEESDEAKIKAIAEKIERFEGLDFITGAMSNQFQDVQNKIQMWQDRKLLGKFQAQFDQALEIKAMAEQRDAVAAILEKSPPEELAVKVRAHMADLTVKSRLAAESLERGKKYRSYGDWTRAQELFSQAKVLFDGSPISEEADKQLAEIREKNGEMARKLRKTTNSLLQGKIEEGVAELKQFLEDQPPAAYAENAREQLQRYSPREDEEPASRLLREAQLHFQRKENKEGRAKVAELIKKYPFAKATSKAMLPVEVTSSPPGVAVKVNGKEHHESTPATVQVPAVGQVRLEFSLDGYTDYETGGSNFSEESVHAKLYRRTAERPVLMPSGATGGMAVKDDWIITLAEEELTIRNTKNPDTKPLTRVRLGAGGGDAAGGEKKNKVYRPVFTLGSPEEILVANHRRSFFRINPSDGRYTTFALESNCVSQVIPFTYRLLPDKSFVGVGTIDGFECINLSSGQRRYPAKLMPKAGGPQKVGLAFDGERFFIPRTDGMLYCIDAESGNNHWSAPVSMPEEPLGPPAAAIDGKHVGLAGKDKLVIWNIKSGRVEVEHELKSPAAFPAAATPHGFLVYTKDGHMRLLSSTKSQVVWEAKAGEGLARRPLLVGDDRFALALPTELQLWDTQSGAILWEANLAAPPVSLVAAEGEPGKDNKPTKRIYVSTKDGYLYRYNAE